MPPQAEALSKSFGADPANHEPRPLSGKLIDAADLILALSRDHRSAVAKLSPKASRKTFTLREFARAIGAEGDTPVIGDFHGWVDFAARHRGLRPGSPYEDNVVDPYGRSEATYLESIQQIEPAVNYITLRLTGVDVVRKQTIETIERKDCEL